MGDEDAGLAVAELVDAGRSHGAPGPCLVWRLPSEMLAISSSMVGGGIGPVSWVLNITVDADYGRFDPDDHLLETAQRLGLTGRGAALMTAVDVGTRTSASADGARVWATVGASRPTWAVDRSRIGGADSDVTDDDANRGAPGTINVVAALPVRLSDAALVNVVSTIAEAKVQALLDFGVDGTGTASDAVTVVCQPDGDAELFGGPRSTWGSRVAVATYDAISSGLSAQRTAVG